MVLLTLDLVAIFLTRQQLPPKSLFSNLNTCSAHLATWSSPPLSLKQLLILQQNMNSPILLQFQIF